MKSAPTLAPALLLGTMILFLQRDRNAIPAHVLRSLAPKHRAAPSGAPRKNHKWETRHLAVPIRDVGAAGRCESVAEARGMYGSGET